MKPYGRVLFLLLVITLGIIASPVSAAEHIISPGADAIRNEISNAGTADGDTILLNRGTYNEYNIPVTKNITLGANPADSANSGNTFIDAQSHGRILIVSGRYNLTIDNLTLRNGLGGNGADGAAGTRFTVGGDGGAGDSGGAIFSDGRVIITSSIIHDCRAGNGGIGGDNGWNRPPGLGGNGGNGGAIYSTGPVEVTGSSFYNCWAGDGNSGGSGTMGQGRAGGVGGNGGAIFTSNGAIIDTTTFTNCHAGNGGTGAVEYGNGGNGGNGGAIYPMIDLTITSSTITSCTAGAAGNGNGEGGAGGHGGGIYTINFTDSVSYMNATFITISNCDAGNGGDAGDEYASGNGGSGGGIYSTWPTVITSSTISGCNAASRGTPSSGTHYGENGRGGAYGGFNYGGTLTLENSTLSGNSAPVGLGGAIGLNDVSQGEMKVTSSNISSNSATSWGAIYYWGTLTATSSTFTGNSGGVIEVYFGNLHLNRFYNNAGTTVYCPYSTTMIDASNNWWGANSNPSGYKFGNVTYSPWLMVCATATPPSISLGDTSRIRANLTYNTEGTNASSGGLFVPDAIPVAFAVTGDGGTVDVAAGETAKGAGMTTFFPAKTGISTIRATVDGQSVSTDVLVPVRARFTGTPVTGLPSLFVQFNDTSDCTAPLTWNWSHGDGTWFNTTDILKRNASHTYPEPGDYTVSLTIANAAESNTTTRTNYITVLIPPPVISDITPVNGPATGGTLVNITGTNLTGATSVTFGTGNPATITANTGTAINVTAPAGTLGLVDVTVTTPGGSVTKNNAYTYVPGPATHLTVSDPSPVTVGSSFSITVTALDALGNTATGYTGTVHFTSSDSAATIPADYTFVSGDAGTHTFSATLNRVGSRTFAATDTVTPGITGTSTITVNPAAGTRFSVTAPASASAGSSSSITVTALDSFGNTATGYTGTVHFTSSDGAATLPADSTLTNGVGSFGVTLKTAGSRTITATDTVTPGITGTSGTVTVNPAAGTRFSVTAPAPASAGSSFSITVTALDSFGNTATGYTGTVHFTSTDGTSLLPADTSLTNGVGSFGVTLKTAGSQTITATDTVTPGITGTSGTVTVNPAAGTRFSVTAPASASAGSSFSITVTALDSFSNIVTGYTGTVHFTSTDSAATLPADYTFVSGDSGSHSFSATLKTTGSQTITATDTITPSITGASDSITVSPGTTTTLAVTAPASAFSGTPFTVAVKALDACGNTVTGYSGTVHFTSTDSASTLPADSSLNSGTGTFSATLATVGSRTITATDTITPSITGTTGTITVSPAPPVPTFSGIAPASGSTTGRTTVTITGTGFTGVSAITFDGIAVSSFTVNSANQITATTPAHAAGAVNVTVTTRGGTATGTGAFTYVITTPDNPPDGGSDDNGPAPAPKQESSATVSANVGGNTPVSRVEVTGTGIEDIIVTATRVSGPRQDTPPAPGIVYQYLDITPARYDTITGATITFSVSQSWLNEHHLAPQDVVMYHNTGTTWQALPAKELDTRDGKVYFSATSPGFSIFAITGKTNGSDGSPGTRDVSDSVQVRTFGDLVKSSDAESPEQAAPPVTRRPVMQTPSVPQTTAVPAPAPVPNPGFPLATVALIGAGCVVLLGSGWYVRRWWIRRQNPALFREYD